MAQRENWYPGHMQKAIQDMQVRLKQVDLVLEIRDARVRARGDGCVALLVRMLIFVCSSSVEIPGFPQALTTFI